MMFGGTRRRATATIIEGVQPLISSLSRFNGLPRGFWEDPYALGYMNGCASMLAKLSTGGKISAMDLGFALTDAFSTLSGGEGKEITRRVIALHNANDADFKLGMSNAIKCVTYTFGLSEFPGDPDIADAKRIGASLGGVLTDPNDPTPERTQTSGALSVLLFQQVVRKRLGGD